jgi:hypothetical protein
MMRSTAILLAIICSAAPAAEPTKSHKPLSFDPPPTPIKGVEVEKVVEFFGAQNYKPLHGKTFCSPRGCYHWEFGGTKGHTGVVDIDSYTGEKDFVGMRMQIAGATFEGAGGRKEDMPALIQAVAEQAQIACADTVRRPELVKLLATRLKQVSYSTKGERQANGCVYNEDTAIFAGLRLSMEGYLKDNGFAETTLRISAAEPREWSDKSGKFKVVADYLSQNVTSAVLIKEDGSEIKVPLAKLSDADRKWLSAAKAESDTRAKRRRDYAARQAGQTR